MNKLYLNIALRPDEITEYFCLQEELRLFNEKPLITNEELKRFFDF